VFRDFVRNRWFPLADLALVCLSIVLWELQPHLSWRPLAIALLPWAVRLFAGRFPFRRTIFDLPLVIFLIMAAVGIWAAYNREIAWAKFWLLIGGLLLFYALAAQPEGNLWTLAGFLALVGFGVAVYFLLTHDWTDQPAKIEILNKAALWWMNIRPTIGLGGIHPNDAAGVMAIMTPFLIAFGGRVRKEKRVFLFIGMVGIGLVVLFAFLLTTSRGAWIALGTAMGIWLLWVLSGKFAHLFKVRREAVFSLALIFFFCLVVGLAIRYPGGLLGMANSLPGPESAGSRWALDQYTLDLIADYPFTGGGLGAFPGLFSQYILVIPVFYLPDGHNIFLDIALEQGVFGLFVFLAILVWSFWLVIARAGHEESQGHSSCLLRWAIFASLIVLSVHGLVEDWIYSDRGLPLLFFLPGLALASTTGYPHASWDDSWTVVPQVRSLSRPWKLSSALLLTIIFAASLFAIRYSPFPIRNSLLSTWYADLGAVQMSQIELANFPSGKWDDGSQVSALAPTEGLFQKALQLNPNNRTAHHRLGLIALLNRDFPTALAHLETAHDLDPAHRGIRKPLGYAYVWAGHPEGAAPLLATIPEARRELSIYVGWWKAQSRPDLSERAKEATQILENQ
jgi:O-antigen ligase